ncbi:MAG: adenine phosphoribosyltransferase, partial [Candidatus Omnitrophica bacterium]|nr:adenine phosphoribosyltransferase [Candidatus Omnitrophota bacterium]
MAPIKKSELKNYIRDIPDFPKEGILFKDITTLLGHKDALKKSVDVIAGRYRKEGIDFVVGVEARGFIFGTAIAYKLNAGFIPVRKKGKLPSATDQIEYDLEYGTDTLEIHKEALPKGSKVLIVDDLLATGGTIRAVADLVKKQDVNIVALAFLIELKFLKGKNK